MTIDAAHALATATTDAVVDNLVTQFADAWDAIRELVQNSLDAGTSRIEVWTEFLPGDGHRGTIAIHVDDFGEGMDEQVIDGQLTKLFASKKEGDLTKIGKFGIGFVSIFALKPKAVLLHTGRGGEYWEVLFHADRSFSKSRLENPVEGTQITLFLEGDLVEYEEAAVRVRTALKKWCKHSETEIIFDDRNSGSSEIINEEFVLPGLCSTNMVPEPGTEFVMVFQESPYYEFFNRGLTIASSNVAENVMSAVLAERFRFVSFKVKSRYLEHTLSRDTVLRDENYAKVMRFLVQGLHEMYENLVKTLESLVAKPSWSAADIHAYGRMLLILASERNLELKHRKIFRGLHGNAYSPRELFDAWNTDGRILLEETPSDLTHQIVEAGVPVIFGRIGHGDASTFPWSALTDILIWHAAEQATSSFVGVVVDIFHAYRPRIASSLERPFDVYLPASVDLEAPNDWKPLVRDTAAVLDFALRTGKDLTTFAPLTTQDTPIFLVAQKATGTLKLPPRAGSIQKAGRIAINREHPHVLKLKALHRVEPQLAAYCLAKCLLLEEDRDLQLDQVLMHAAQGIA